MRPMVGVLPSQGNYEDFQRMFKCENIHSVHCNDKGLQFPTTCSVPPCNTCSAQRIGKLKIIQNLLLTISSNLETP